jgi:hypothetical protein
MKHIHAGQQHDHKPSRILYVEFNASNSDLNISGSKNLVQRYGPISVYLVNFQPVTVAERSKACTVFSRSEAGIVSSNSTQGLDV